MIYSKHIFLDQFSPVSIYHKMKKIFPNEVSFLFESVVNNDSGNFSFIIIGAKERIWHKNNKSFYIDESGKSSEVDSNPLAFLKKKYQEIDKDIYKKYVQELEIGFVDGFIGYIGYEMSKEFEPKLKESMRELKDGLDIPDFDMIRPKLILAYSHKNSKLTLVSSIESFKDEFSNITKELKSNHEFIPIKPAEILSDGEMTFDKSKFFEMIAKSKEMIKSGDVFQILMANRFRQRAKIDKLSFYRVLRAKNPSPYLFCLDFDDFTIAGSSPEVMVKSTDRQILLRPIAGTRKRGSNKARDKELELELLNDEKELAEHIMLVDLGRNDVGRVAKSGTLRVTGLKRVEKYSHVMHLVSDVEATLDEQYDMFDLFQATFTAGTMTGAPKIRAMELIAKIEGVKRSFYSGSIGYFGFDGNLDSTITIRTALITDDEIILQAGAGVVADSKPELEFLEVTNKMKALKSSIEDLSNIDKTSWN